MSVSVCTYKEKKLQRDNYGDSQSGVNLLPSGDINAQTQIESQRGQGETGMGW